MKDASYLVAIAYETVAKETRFANSVIKVSPLKYLMEKREMHSPSVTRVTLLWWKQLTEEEEEEAAGIGEAAF
jgi:hypothetical protein